MAVLRVQCELPSDRKFPFSGKFKGKLGLRAIVLRLQTRIALRVFAVFQKPVEESNRELPRGEQGTGFPVFPKIRKHEGMAIPLIY